TVEERASGEAGIHGEIGAHELIKFATAPGSPWALHEAGNDPRTGNNVATSRARQSQREFSHTQFGVCGPANRRSFGWLDRLFQPQNGEISSRVAAGDTRRPAYPVTQRHGYLPIVPDRVVHGDDGIGAE